jgi:hypothetical protein
VPDGNSFATPAGGNDPGPQRLIQAFANTLSASPETDLLSNREEAAAWLHTEGLLPDDAGLSNSEHAALVRLRDAIKLVIAADAGGRDEPEAAARLTKALADGRIVLTAEADGSVRLASAARAPYPNIVALFAIAISDAAASGTWPRLKSD